MEKSIFSEIVRFLGQAGTDNLVQSGYLKTYNGLDVKFSFGAGNVAKVPWISFTGFGQRVQEGIYPVYLYYKRVNLLILAYGVSATTPPNRNWHFPEERPPTTKEYFRRNGLGEPERYPESFIYKVYEILDTTNRGLDEATIVGDLDALLDEYKGIFENPIPEEPETPIQPPPTIVEPNPAKTQEHSLVSKFLDAAKSAHYRVSEDLATRYIASLLTKPFVILTGLSGSGKTKLAQVFAEWICESEEQYRIVPVGADWTNREPLLGFPNALDRGRYVSPDSRVLELMIAAERDPDKPYFLILDEMNMSHVERYFADFLSAMESGEKIFLHPESHDLEGIPSSVTLPANLFMVGTVNIDETTYMFSPKVLDRANVIEFRVSDTEMDVFLRGDTHSAIEMKRGSGSELGNLFMNLRNGEKQSHDFAREKLMEFFRELRPIGAEFGYRTASEISRFFSFMKKLSPDAENDAILDGAIFQKLLPKVHGSRSKLDPVLKKLIGLCMSPSEAQKELVDALIKGSKVPNEPDLLVRYPLSLEKLLRMYRNMTDNGFTSFAEA